MCFINLIRYINPNITITSDAIFVEYNNNNGIDRKT